jgi:predicted restriction endonuclease
LNDERFLIASHIQRWAESNDNERRDTNNAFLLCSDHDWLFDKFYISFDDAGNISLNDSLDKVIYENLKISKDLNNISLNSENKKYMKWHRKEFYKKNNI